MRRLMGVVGVVISVFGIFLFSRIPSVWAANNDGEATAEAAAAPAVPDVIHEAAPQASSATLDTDHDGIPNAVDPDVDGKLNSVDTDVDGDGIPNAQDTDIDGDGTPNTTDKDIDGDGRLNAVDPDIDGDGVPNAQDADMDGDGTPNAADADTDGDGTLNAQDADPGSQASTAGAAESALESDPRLIELGLQVETGQVSEAAAQEQAGALLKEDGVDSGNSPEALFGGSETETAGGTASAVGQEPSPSEAGTVSGEPIQGSAEPEASTEPGTEVETTSDGTAPEMSDKNAAEAPSAESTVEEHDTSAESAIEEHDTSAPSNDAPQQEVSPSEQQPSGSETGQEAPHSETNGE